MKYIVSVINPHNERVSIFPPNDGTSQRIFNLLIDIDKEGINSTVYSIGFFNQDLKYKMIQEKVIQGRRIKRKPGILYTILDHSIYPFTGMFWSGWILDFNNNVFTELCKQETDLIELSAGSPMMGKISVKWAKRMSLPILYSAHNFATDIYSSFYKKNVPRFLHPLEKHFTNPILKKEINFANNVDHIICVSKEDKKNFQNYGIKGEKVSIIPNGVNWNLYRTIQLKIEQKEALKEKLGFSSNDFIVTFIGSANYLPNDDAVRNILQIIAPECQKLEQDIKFLIIGRNRPFIRIRNVLIIGEVQSIPPLLKISDLAICPLRYGGGTKLKVLEYLASGLPVLTTSIGIEGLEIGNRSYFIENNLKNFANIIVQLRLDELKRKELSKEAIEASSSYSWSKIRKEYAVVLKKIIDMN